MKGKMLLVGGTLLYSIGMVYAYGKYKYYSGKVDANKFNRVIIDAQQLMIKDLLEKVKELESQK